MHVLGDSPTTFRWRGPGLLLPDEPCNFLVRLFEQDTAYAEHAGYLSLKLVFGGREYYEHDRRTVAVEESRYLLLNYGQRYASHIPPDGKVESLAVFFDPQYASDVLTTLSTPLDRLIELPDVVDQPVHFFDRLYPQDPSLTRMMAALRHRMEGETASAEWLSEWFPAVLERILYVHRGLRPEIAAIDAARPSTRQELYRRLLWGRDFLNTCYVEAITVADAAQAACLSRYRFLRLFKQAFGITPHAYLTDLRMEEARRLLRRTELSVTDICLAVGFESLGSFSWLFRKRHGVSPSAWRRALGNSATSEKQG